MTFQFFIKIDLANDALSDAAEVKRLLLKAADNLTDECLNYSHSENLTDINGNPVGSYGLLKVKEEFTYQGCF